MKRVHILADDLTGALDCAAAFGAGVPVHLGQPGDERTAGIDIVATATRDVPLAHLAGLLQPSLAWLSSADLAFKKVDSLLRGNTFAEVDGVARQAHFAGLAMVPAFPAQGRLTEDGQQWWQRPRGERTAVAQSIRHTLTAQGWSVVGGVVPPEPGAMPVAWVPDVRNEAEMDAVAAHAVNGARGWLWCGSAGLAHALAKFMPMPTVQVAAPAPSVAGGAVMLVSASHHDVTREQWRVLTQSDWAGGCFQGEDSHRLAEQTADYPTLIDLSAQALLTPSQAAALLAQQARLIALHAPRPRTLVVVGGDTLLALCHALGATGLRSEVPLARAGWGCARMQGGRWDGLVCHTRSGAFGGPEDLLQVLNSL
jgi:uncharacterized protein YgbK (DUF1537 family)